jgi:adenine-specific DNA glycosylase
MLVGSVGRSRTSLADAVIVLGHHATHACAEQAPHCTVCPLQSGCAYAVARRGPGLS